MSNFNEEAPVVIDEQVILEKIDDASGQVVERLHISNGTIVQHDFLIDNEVVTTKEYGGDE